MRDLLTILAAGFLLLIGGLWLGPTYLDWQAHRAAIDGLVTRAIGLETRSSGAIRLAILPVPRLSLGAVTVGETGKAGLTADTLDAELALTPLLRGEWRFRLLRLDGVEARLDLAQTGALPALDNGARSASPVAFDRIEVMRGRLVLTRAGAPLVRFGSVALEASAPARHGPWRVTGEIGGHSLRLASGEAGADGVRLRLNLGSAEGPTIESEGLLSLPEGKPTFAGTWQLRPQGDPAAEGQASGRLTLDPDRLTLPEIALEWGPVAGLTTANRLTGALSLPLTTAEPGILRLTGRRIDLGPLSAPVAPPLLAGRHWLAPDRPIQLALDAEQVVIGGEDMSRVTLAGAWQDRRLSIDAMAGRFAGLDWRAQGDAQADRATLDLTLSSTETGRLALALARLGLDAPLADLVGAQGQVEASGRMAWSKDRLALEGWRGMSGGASWSFDAAQDRTGRMTLRLDGDGIRLDRLPALSGARGLDGSASLNLTRARIGTALGDVRATIERQGTTWRVSELAARGFGGLVLEGSGETGRPGARLDLRLEAPQALPAVTLLAPFLPETLAARLRAQAQSISPVRLAGTVTQQQDGQAIAATGQMAAMRTELAAGIGADGAMRTASLRLQDAATDQLARLVGLPPPQRTTTGVTVDLGLTGERLSIRLTAPDLAVEASGQWRQGLALDLSTRSAADRLLPAPLAGLAGRDRVLDGRANLRFDGHTGWQISRLATRAGSQGNGTRLTFSPGSHLAGEIELPSLDVAALLASGLQAEEITDAAGRWSTRRFGTAGFALTARLGLKAQTMTLAPAVSSGPVALQMVLNPDEMQITDLGTALASGTVKASLRVGRSGGLGSIGGDITLASADAARLASGLSGTYSAQLTLGGSGETMAQIMASLGGQGTVRLQDIGIAGHDPSALAAVIGDARDELLDRAQMEAALGRALARAPLRLPAMTLPLNLTAGTLRAALPPQMEGGTRVEASGQIDLRQMILDARLRMMPAERPRGWVGEMPQLALRWAGPVAAPVRQLDAGLIVNGLAQRRLQQEMDRLDAFNADLRERSFFARRLRAERDMATRPPVPGQDPGTSPQAGAAPPLPPPVEITPVPGPLSRQPERR